jgi:hypothetical protein
MKGYSGTREGNIVHEFEQQHLFAVTHSTGILFVSFTMNISAYLQKVPVGITRKSLHFSVCENETGFPYRCIT